MILHLWCTSEVANSHPHSLVFANLPLLQPTSSRVSPSADSFLSSISLFILIQSGRMKMTSFLRCWEPQPPLLACCLLWGLNGPLAPPQWPLCGRCVHLGDDDHPAKITFWQSGGVAAHGVCTQIPPRCISRRLLLGWLVVGAAHCQRSLPTFWVGSSILFPGSHGSKEPIHNVSTGAL